MKKLLIATHNSAKFSELKSGLLSLENAGIELVSLADLGIQQEPEETGKTFAENALLKAEYYANLTHLPSLADDGGICIDALGGEPGIKSHIWLGRDATDEELIEYTLKRLKNIPKAKRTAYFTTTLCFYDPGTKTKLFEEGRLKGYISDQIDYKRIKSYPYRSLFIVKDLNIFYTQLTTAQHIKLNHRLHALKRLVKKMKPYLLQ